MVRLIKTETVISVLMGHFIKKLLFILLFVGVLIAPANAQNEKNMYSYKKIGNKYIVSINNHTEIVKALNAFCKEKGILSGSINGIGAIGVHPHPHLLHTPSSRCRRHNESAGAAYISAPGYGHATLHGGDSEVWRS